MPLKSPLVNVHHLPDYWQKALFKAPLSQLIARDGTIPLKAILVAIRDMPYHRPQQGNNAQACLAEWCGTCSAKHLAVHDLLTHLGYQAELWMASYLMRFDKPYFSDALKGRAKKILVYDVHNYLKCTIANKEIIIDVTFPIALAKYGFPVTPSWDGHNNFVLCCQAIEAIKLNADLTANDKKRQWLQELNSAEAIEIRESAIIEMAQFTQNILNN
ncbi:MAG: hypothetical protein Q4G54_05320 [Pelistega sp.]|nr:hypothetical protein [Pelistega sp.]